MWHYTRVCVYSWIILHSSVSCCTRVYVCVCVSAVCIIQPSSTPARTCMCDSVSQSPSAITFVYSYVYVYVQVSSRHMPVLACKQHVVSLWMFHNNPFNSRTVEGKEEWERSEKSYCRATIRCNGSIWRLAFRIVWTLIEENTLSATLIYCNLRI